MILGLPRTGTTHLASPAREHPDLRSLPFWESLEPIPARAVREGRARDRRRERAAQALAMQRRVMPLFPAMHEIAVDAPEEEIQLLAVDFRTMFFEAMSEVPTYAAWNEADDHAGAYRYLKRMLQALQWLRPHGTRWLLKSPQHLERIGPLLDAPDARIVHTHCGSVRVVASMCTMLAYGRRMQTARVDVAALGRAWSERIARMLDASARDRARVPAGHAMDLPLDAFLADEVGAALRVAAFAGLDAGPAPRARFEMLQAAKPRGRHGRIDYRLEDSDSTQQCCASGRAPTPSASACVPSSGAAARRAPPALTSASAPVGSGTTSAAGFSTSSDVHSSPIEETGLQRDGVPPGIARSSRCSGTRAPESRC